MTSEPNQAKIITPLKIVLMAGEVIVAEYEHAPLWEEVLAAIMKQSQLGE